MAGTAEGAQLTRIHRIGQLTLRSALIRDLLILWGLFDPTDPASYDEFMQLAEVLIRTRYRDSAGLAAIYYREFLEAEGIRSMVTVRTAEPPEEERLRIALVVTGLVGVLRARRAGLTLDAAKAQGFVLVSGAASRLALEGGRATILGAVQADGLVTGWQRATSGDPCAFCAMLAARGPVYKEDTVRFEAHDHCSCYPEPHHAGSEWPAANQQFRDLWNEATVGTGGRDALNAFRRALEAR